MNLASENAAPADTLHARIRQDIEGNILSGVWPPGHRIPFEHELMDSYGCSRMTVSKVLSTLAENGLIERRRRAGTFVAVPRFQAAVLQIPDIRAEVLGRGFDYTYRALKVENRKSGKDEQHRLQLKKPGPIVVVNCLHLANGKPFALEYRLINLATVPEAAQTDFGREPPGSWLVSKIAWSEGDHRIYAHNPTPEEAAILQIEPRNACLVIERHTWRGSEPITFARQIFPGGMFEMNARFTPA